MRPTKFLGRAAGKDRGTLMPERGPPRGSRLKTQRAGQLKLRRVSLIIVHGREAIVSRGHGPGKEFLLITGSYLQ